MPKAFYLTGDISTGCQLSPMFLYQAGQNYKAFSVDKSEYTICI